MCSSSLPSSYSYWKFDETCSDVESSYLKELLCNICNDCTTISRVKSGDATPINIYLFKDSNRSTRKRCDICSKETIKTPKRPHWRRSSIFIVNLEHISQLFLVFPLVDFEQVNASWDCAVVVLHDLCCNDKLILLYPLCFKACSSLSLSLSLSLLDALNTFSF